MSSSKEQCPHNFAYGSGETELGAKMRIVYSCPWCEIERLTDELRAWERRTRGQVWIPNEEYAALCALRNAHDEGL